MRARGPMARLVALAMAVSFLAIPASSANRSLEYAVKATFLYKFASFVEWPAGTFPSESSPFVLCVMGVDPYGGRIQEAVAGQSVGGHPVVVRSIVRADARPGCHAMFVSGSSTQDVAAALRAVAGTPTLTITDSSLGPTAGIVHFVIVDDRVSFDIDNYAAARNHLVISSKLLGVARNHNVRAGRGR